MSIRLRASDDAVSEVDERYLSFCIDLGQIAEPTRFWNPDGSGETTGRPSYDFGRVRLRNLARALAPALLRIGGTEADRAFYALDGAPPARPPPPYCSVLTAAHVDAVGAFAKACGLQIMFAVNAGWGARANTNGPWEAAQARALMKYVRARGHAFVVWELGNEPNGWPFLQRNLAVTPEAYAADLLELTNLRDAESPGSLVAAPSTAWFPSTVGEVPAIATTRPPQLISWGGYLRRALAAAASLERARSAALGNQRRRVPDVVTWHFYPGQSDRVAPNMRLRATLAAYRRAAAGAAVAAAAAAWAAAVGWPGRVLGGGAAGLAGAVGLAAAAAAAAVFVVVVFLAHVLLSPVGPRTLTDPRRLDRVRHWAKTVSAAAEAATAAGGDAISDAGAPARRDATTPECWLGETGSAQAGGQPGVSGRWVGALWWLDQLGAVAAAGHRLQCRQTLSGSDYGLLDDGTLAPTAEFWCSVLWRRLMGTRVFAVDAAPRAPRTLRLYCHDGRAPQKGSDSARAAGGGGVRVYLAINLAAPGSAPAQLDAGVGADGACDVWLLTAAALDATEMAVNGAPPAAAADGVVPDLPPRREWGGRITLPAGAAAFVRVGGGGGR